jgi:hypothetical protein
MAYVDAFLLDVFVSFAREDNLPLSEEAAGWVTQFVQNLEVALKLELGDGVSIFFDEQNRFSHLPPEYLKDNIRNSAFFIPLISPAYIVKGWAEFRTFTATPGAIGRLALVEISPAQEQTDPLAVKTARSIPFWVSEGGQIRRLNSETDSQLYSLHLARLANQIVEALRELRPQRQAKRRGGQRFQTTLNALKGVAKEAETELPKDSLEERKDENNVK